MDGVAAAARGQGRLTLDERGHQQRLNRNQNVNQWSLCRDLLALVDGDQVRRQRSFPRTRPTPQQLSTRTLIQPRCTVMTARPCGARCVEARHCRLLCRERRRKI